MKTLNLFFVLIFLSISSTFLIAQAPAEVQGPVMTFESMIVDYGDIEQNSEPLRVLKFTNTGTEPLVVSNARGSCGCTVPTWPKQPIMPGESSQLEIRYDTKRLGGINKTVTLTTNEGTESHVIKVIGTIHQAAPEEGVPTNKGGLIKPNK
jgi:hypothetical protein